MKDKYIILSSSDMPPTDDILRYDIEGSANTVRQAKKFICDSLKKSC